MGYSRKPGPLDEAPAFDPASPMAPVTTVGDSGPVGMKGGGGACGGAPTLRRWPRSISWREFRDIETQPPGESENAQIHSEAILDEGVTVCRDDGRLRLGRFNVRLRVTEADSWVVTSAKTDALLAHEQGHFDLAGLDARQLMHDLAALRADDATELQRLVTERIARSRTDAQALSDRYDHDTNHGINTARQALWEAAIRQAIDSGHAFTAPP
jgi:hypothetical protein